MDRDLNHTPLGICPVCHRGTEYCRECWPLISGENRLRCPDCGQSPADCVCDAMPVTFDFLSAIQPIAGLLVGLILGRIFWG